MLTKYQRDLALSRREARKFRTLMDAEIGEELDENPRSLRYLVALDLQYQAFVNGEKVNRKSFLSLLTGGAPNHKDAKRFDRAYKELCKERFAQTA